ncbi:MAG: hypothetical protein ACAH17_03485 [Candidatus Paceibacterota bacterium]
MNKALSILIVSIVFCLTQGCGVPEQLSKNCKGSDIEMGCNTVFGSRDNEQDERLDDLVSKLERQANALIASTNLLQTQLTQLYVNDSEQTAQIAALEFQIDSQQVQINSLLAQLAVLSTNNNQLEIIDPCGDGPGFDEVLIRSGSTLLAYFEQGSHRHISSLGPGFYQTTDAHKCSFTVNAQLQVCDSSGCK